MEMHIEDDAISTTIVRRRLFSCTQEEGDNGLALFGHLGFQASSSISRKLRNVTATLMAVSMSILMGKSSVQR